MDNLNEMFGAIGIISAVFSACLLVMWIDSKHNLRIADWLNGRCDNPFKAQPQTQSESAKDQKIAELTERIQVLETIVTEPAYELNQKINSL